MERAYFNMGLGLNTPFGEAETLLAKFLSSNNTGLKLMRYNQGGNRFESLLYNSNNDKIIIDWCPDNNNIK